MGFTYKNWIEVNWIVDKRTNCVTDKRVSSKVSKRFLIYYVSGSL